jgi:hypothetical protein
MHMLRAVTVDGAMLVGCGAVVACLVVLRSRAVRTAWCLQAVWWREVRFIFS